MNGWFHDQAPGFPSWRFSSTQMWLLLFHAGFFGSSLSGFFSGGGHCSIHGVPGMFLGRGQRVLSPGPWQMAPEIGMGRGDRIVLLLRSAIGEAAASAAGCSTATRPLTQPVRQSRSSRTTSHSAICGTPTCSRVPLTPVRRRTPAPAPDCAATSRGPGTPRRRGAATAPVPPVPMSLRHAPGRKTNRRRIALRNASLRVQAWKNAVGRCSSDRLCKIATSR